MSAAQPLSGATRDRQGSQPPVRLRNMLLGALGGAVLMLLALPASRPYYVDAVAPSPLDRALASTADIARGSRLPDPRSLSGQAMWFSVAAGRIIQGHPVSSQEIQTVEGLMAAAAREESGNAFWLQADAALLERLGRSKAAEQSWLSAAKRLSWDDHQNDYLDDTLVGRRNVPSYAYAELYELRTSNAVELIKQGGRALLRATWERPNLNIRMRLATVLNGNLVRQRARSIDTMRVGTEIIESAVSKPSDEREPSQHHLLVARTNFYKAVASANLGYDEASTQLFFDEADAARALTTIEDVQVAMQTEAAEAAILHSASGALILCAFWGAALLGVRWLLGRIAGVESGPAWSRTIFIAVVAVAFALFLTSAYAAFALGLCIVFAGSTPSHVRKRRPTSLGPLYSLMTSSVTFALLLAGAFGLMLTAAPCRVLLLPKLPEALSGSAAVCGVGALAIGFLFLCAPLWAYAQRLPTVYVLGIGLRDIGHKLILTSLLLGVVSGPMCVFLDRLLVESRLRHQFVNEPLYYYQKLSPSTSIQNDADARP